MSCLIKKYSIFINVFFFLVSLISCSWDRAEIYSTRPSEDLVKSFDLDEKKLQKFKTVKVNERLPQKEKEFKQNGKKVKIKRQVKEKRAKKRSALPADYPAAFTDYDTKSQKVWKKYSSNIYLNERMVFDVKYFGVTAGKVVVRTLPIKKIGDKSVYHFKADLKSAPFYKYIYTLDDYVESYVERERFLPLKYSLKQNESKQTVDDLQLFELEEKKTYFFYKRIKKDRNKNEKKNAPIPSYFLDSFSPLFFARGLPLNLGDVYEFPLITRTKVRLLKFEIKQIENIVVMDEKVSAIRVKAQTRFPENKKKKGDIVFWYSNDKVRRLLKFQAKVKIGAIEGDLVDFSQGSLIESL